jgi:hypothetical protein
VYFAGGTKGGRFGAVAVVDEKDIVGRVKVEICEQWDLDPRLTSVVRDPEQQRQSLKPWRIDQARSFLDNEIAENDRLQLCPSAATSRICPVCLTTNVPTGKPQSFGAFFFHYCCTNCGWHWEVSEKPMAGILSIQDEMVHVNLDAPDFKVTWQHCVPSCTKAKSILEYFYMNQGVRKAARSGILDMKNFELLFEKKALDLEKPLTDQGIHFYANLTLQVKPNTSNNGTPI